MRIVGAAAAVMVFAGCYAPSFADCELACAGTGADACPAGLTCASGSCRLPGMTEACNVTPMIDAPMACWPYAASNVDPCAADFPASVGPLTVASMKTIDTTAPSDGVPIFAGRYILLHVDSVNVMPGAVLTVNGPRPLIIVSDGNVDITGTILVQPLQAFILSPMDCAGGSAAMMGSTSSGGYGGGYGTAGGNGGGSLTVNSTSGGVVNGDPMLVPLRPGCAGGRGAGPTVPAGGLGGRGGNALQITSKTQLNVGANGTVVAGGGGGGGGAYTNCAGTPCTAGGGGGGAGGSILLEGDSVEVRAQARVCAVGGAGGNGPQTSTAPAMAGANGTDAMLCTGGTPGSIGNRGGRGADVAGAAGPAGSNGTGNLDSGAGGGGGLGRIRIRGVQSRTVLGTVIPAPTL